MSQTHCLSTQDCPEAQPLPQPPQLLRSVARSVHCPLHTNGSVPARQLQWLFWQTSPEMHVFPHEPQFFGSLVSLTH